MPWKTLLVGLGGIGLNYDIDLDKSKYCFSHANSLDRLNAFELSAVVDNRPQALESFNKVYSSATFNKLENALKANEYDVIVISTPSETHVGIIDNILSSKHPKFILIEKPIAENLVATEYIVNACRSKNIDIYVNYFRRAELGSKQVKTLIDSQLSSSYITGIVWYSKGILHTGTHFIDLLSYWLGPIIKSNLIKKRDNINPDLQLFFKNSDVLLKYTGFESFSKNSIELISNKGVLKYENGGRVINWHPVFEDKLFKGFFFPATNAKSIPSNFNNYQLSVYQNIDDYLSNRDKIMIPSAKETLAYMSLIDGLLR